MSKDINLEFLDKTKKVLFSYEGKIPEGLSHYYKDILEGNNIEMYMQSYNLTEEQVRKYARVCKIRDIYDDIFELVDILKNEMDTLAKEEVDEYQSLIDELQTSGEEYLDGLGEEKTDDVVPVDSDDVNLIIYSNFINESYDKTVNAHSGREEQSLKAIANLIEQLNKVEYQELRKKGYIHQNQQMGSNKPCYLDGNAFERLGRGSSKVNYIRIPISENNRKEIKKSINKDFSTFYLIVSYGDFKNEGLDELRYYGENYLNLKKNSDALIAIMDIFRNDFTKETFPVAMDLIANGFRTTRGLTAILKTKSEPENEKSL